MIVRSKRLREDREVLRLDPTDRVLAPSAWDGDLGEPPTNTKTTRRATRVKAHLRNLTATVLRVGRSWVRRSHACCGTQKAAGCPQAPRVVPDRPVAHGDRLGWQHDAAIIGAPDHTPGHVAAWFADDRVLVAGDALASHDGQTTLGAFNADPAAAAATAKRLATLDAEAACFGHGEPLRSDAAARLARVTSRP